MKGREVSTEGKGERDVLNDVVLGHSSLVS
jgi:hypothetical protein